jgi:MFS family permease
MSLGSYTGQADVKAVSSQAVTLNVPAMSRDLNLTQLQAQWVVSAYSLAYACGLLFSGRIADVYGRKMCFLIGMGVFVVFSIISGVMRVSSAMCTERD